MEIENVLIKTEHIDEEDCCDIVEEDVKVKDTEDAETSNEKPYKCGICGHRTTTDTLLKVHMKMHLIKRVHQCNICRKTFNFVTELNSHILTHTEAKSNFQCEICDRDCFTEEDLHRHYRIHTKEKPFKCKLCFRSFSDDSYLRIHERSHHGEDYLKKNMKKDGTYVNPSLVQNSHDDGTPKVSVQKTIQPKKFKNHSNLPLNNEEKLLLLQYVEELGLNTKYLQLEQIKSYLKNSWAKMVDLFAERCYDRNPEKLARTYFHLKNQAKIHIERFYKNKRLPEPHEIDYLFVKLCPTEFDIPGIDIEQVQEDGKKFARGSSTEVIERLEEDDKDSDDVDPFFKLDSLSENTNYINSGFPSSSQKRMLSDEDDGPPRKVPKNENLATLNEINKLKVKFLLAEEERKDRLYQIQLKGKQELFVMEKKHKEDLYKKELEIKDLELVLLRQKVAK